MAFKYKLLFFLLGIYISYSKCIATEEPKCSKFDFEEKVLEKMVRVEHASGLMMEEFKKLTTEVKENLDIMKREFSELKHQTQQDLGQYQRLIEDYVNRPPHAFSAFWLAKENPAKGEALVFNRILVNENDAYNKNTGEYTVPVNGTYMFISTLCTHANQWVKVQFVADGKVIGAFRASDRDWDVCTSSSATSNLQKGMKVKIIVVSTDSGTVLYNHEDWYLSSFSGHQIK